jgi:hypothetical protein
MPEDDKKMVDLDTSGPEVDIELPEKKEEAVVEQPKETTEQETDKTYENERETKLEEKQETSEEVKEGGDDDKLEEYSKGVQSRIAKLTRKMREAERRERAALDYAKAVEEKRKTAETKFSKVNDDYVKQFETRVKTGLESAQKELASAIENADAAGQIEANKKIAALSIDEARLNALKEQQTITKEEPAPKLSDAEKLPESTPKDLPSPDPRAEDWAGRNAWFGKDRAMTFTAFEIHKDLVEREGFDPQTDEYYAEVDKRIRLEFPHKFDTKETQTSKPTQNVASVKRSAVRQGRQTVRLTSSQVAIAKKLGVPLEEYAKQLNITKEV